MTTIQKGKEELHLDKDRFLAGELLKGEVWTQRAPVKIELIIEGWECVQLQHIKQGSYSRKREVIHEKLALEVSTASTKKFELKLPEELTGSVDFEDRGMRITVRYQVKLLVSGREQATKQFHNTERSVEDPGKIGNEKITGYTFIPKRFTFGAVEPDVELWVEIPRRVFSGKDNVEIALKVRKKTESSSALLWTGAVVVCEIWEIFEGFFCNEGVFCRQQRVRRIAEDRTAVRKTGKTEITITLGLPGETVHENMQGAFCKVSHDLVVELMGSKGRKARVLKFPLVVRNTG